MNPVCARERRAAEVPGEELGVERGGHEHDLEIGSAGQEIAEHDEEEILVHPPLVNLVHEDVAHAASVGSAASRRSNTPVVQNKSFVSDERRASSRI